MAIGMGVPRGTTIARREARIPMEVGVHISGHASLPGKETTFTENVSAHGARVLTTRKWSVNDRLTIATLPGSFRANARVTYCQPVADRGFAVGLEFVEPIGKWVVGDHFGN
jgi:PilZ domain-containing protein